ncbi:MAG: NAD-dependent DNA ligase LigA [Bacteroidia bacterium]
MNEEQALHRILALTRELNDHNYRYYVLDRPIISDQQFDDLLSELTGLEHGWPHHAQLDSPTRRVGGQPLDGFDSAIHATPMLSLGNTYSESELRDFDQRVQKILGRTTPYLAELKIDGVAISLTYENGMLVQAITRGDGTRGDVVTANIRAIPSIPIQLRGLNWPQKMEVRGEVFIRREKFEELNRRRQENGEEVYANPRNFASGSLKLLDATEVKRRGLDAYFYAWNQEQASLGDQEAMLKKAIDWGFPVCTHNSGAGDLEQVLGFIRSWQSKRETLDFDIDGIVVKVNSYSDREELGHTAKAPRWAIAYKYKTQAASTQLISVDFQVGRTGAVTPVANLAPVWLGGTTVKRASLYNEGEIERLGLRLNDRVWVEKGGEIIPKITGVDTTKGERGHLAIQFPLHCPSCDAPLQRIDALHYCLNSKNCPPQQLGLLEHFVARKAMDLNSLGKETLELLWQQGLVRNPADLYDLQHDALSSLERMGKKSAQLIIDGLADSRAVPYHRVLFALGIRHVGETIAKNLAKHFPSIELLAAASLQELLNVHDIGEKIAEQVVGWFSDPDHARLLERLKQFGLQFTAVMGGEQQPNHSQKLLGLSFVVSGVFERHEREQLKILIEQHGGRVAASLSGKTNYLLSGSDAGPSKLEKAKQLHVPLLTETEFEQLIA